MSTATPSIAPIPTLYNGHLFRSRLEARWCVALDTLGIRYQYEPEGFQTEDGERYLPDLFLPEINCYAEIKPEHPNAHLDFLKCQRFVMKGMGQRVLFLVGPPDFRAYTVFRRIALADGTESWLDNVCLDIYLHPKWYFEEHRLYGSFPEDEFQSEDDFSLRYREAVYASRKERFDSPNPFRGMTRKLIAALRGGVA